MSYNSLAARPLMMNGFTVELPSTVEVLVREFPDPKEVKAERERLQGYWFVHWVAGRLYHLRLKGGGPNVEATPTVVETSEHAWLLRARLDDAISTIFAKYDPIRERPFTFLAQKSELIGAAAEAAGIDHLLLKQFRVTPKFSLNSKTYELAGEKPKVGVFVTVGMRYDIEAQLTDLKAAGVPLSGLYVVKRAAAQGERRLAGRIQTAGNGTVQAAEGAEAKEYNSDELKLEGSKENFATCLKVILGSRYKSLMDALDDQASSFTLGPGFNKIIEQMGTFLQKSAIDLGSGISARVGPRVMIGADVESRGVYVAPVVDYVFDRTGSKSDEYAWRGLAQYGPYDRTTFANKSPRILVAFPSSTRGKVETFLKSFRDGMGASFKAFPKGFRDLFGLVSVDFVMCEVAVSADSSLAESAYRTAIEAKLSTDNDIHAGLIVLLDEHAFLPGLQNPYIRTKSLLLTLGIPTQEVRMATINQRPESLQYTLQNFSISSYAKLNGTPWTVNQDKAISDELVIGMGFAELSGDRFGDRQRYAGITTVFSGDGTYLLGNVSKECSYDTYAGALRDSMLSVLKELKARNNWHPGDTIRVIFHAQRPLKRIDVGKIVFACTREVGSEQNIQMAFVTVAEDHPFFLLDQKEAGIRVRRDSEIRKGVLAPARGTIAKLGRLTRLLCVNAGTLIKRANTPLPKPLLVSLHPDSTFKDVDYLAEQVLKFTSLSWRSTLPAGTAVTIFYSERIAELLGRLRSIPDWSPTALATKLKWSRWFL